MAGTHDDSSLGPELPEARTAGLAGAHSSLGPESPEARTAGLLRPYVSNIRPRHLREEPDATEEIIGPHPVANDDWDTPPPDERPGRWTARRLVVVAVATAAVLIVISILTWGQTDTAPPAAEPDPSQLAVPEDAPSFESATPTTSTSPSALASPSLTPTPPTTAARTTAPSSANGAPAGGGPAAGGQAPTPAQTGPTPLAIVPRTGAVVSAAGKCVDNNSNWAKEGNAIQAWDCNHTQAQTWAHGSDGTLRTQNMCIRPAGSAPSSGTLVQLRACDGSYQAWYFRSDQVLVNAASGLCLTDPGVETDGKPQLTVATCTATAGQRWSIS